MLNPAKSFVSLLLITLIPAGAIAGSRIPPRPEIRITGEPVLPATVNFPQSKLIERGTEGKLAGAPILTNGMISVAVTSRGLLLASHGQRDRTTVRARLVMFSGTAQATAFSKATIEEYGRSQISVKVCWRAKGKELAVMLTLQRGHVTFELKPLQNTDAVSMAGPEPAGIIVPAFYGDDFIFDPVDAKPGSTVFIPSEYLLLWPVNKGTAMVQAVWNPPATGNGAATGTIVTAEVAQTDNRHSISSTRLTFDNNSIFFAAWEAPGLWQKIRVDSRFGDFTGHKTRDVKLAWKPPYAAKWVAIVHGAGYFTSWDMKQRPWQGKIGPHGRERFYSWPFWFNKGHYWLHLPPSEIQKTVPDYVLIYPVKRAKRTPIQVKLPDDILKEALNTGICEHLFQTGGGGNPGGPLCELIRRFKILAKLYTNAGRGSNLLQAHARWMYEQGEWQYRRIREYRDFGKKIIAVCAAAVKEHPELAQDLAEIDKQAQAIVKACNRTLAEGAAVADDFRDFRPAATEPVAAMDEILKQLGKWMAMNRPNPLPAILDLGHKLHRIALCPQGALPRPRAMTRLIQNHATRLAVRSPAASSLAASIRGLARKALAGKHWAEQER